jgi:hypothetical protein
MGRRVVAVVSIVILGFGVFCHFGYGQEAPDLAVSPANVTMLVGETHTFRAVGKDGRMKHGVEWNISSSRAASFTIDGDEATLVAKEPSTVTVTADEGGDSAHAVVDIRAGDKLALGTVKWAAPQWPGCKTVKVVPAVPTQDGPDIYAAEDCSDGNFMRAFTADGRELWRTNLSSRNAPVPAGIGSKQQTSPYLKLDNKSVCDAVSPGMGKDAASKLIDDRKLPLDEKTRQRNVWQIEEEGSRCTISFDGKTGTVVKKKKIIVTD